ncbi:type II secretion system protein N [Variovorax humicola]|uniref:Type II secretion system protein N n=1 Tax=Variovorax humicola TaxID=1769758 RepID=A0ABU8VS50_9BURK
MIARANALPARPASGWRWAVLGALLGGLAALAVFAPARWLAQALREATNGRLLLVNPRGTVWNGTAGVVLASGQGGAQPVSLPGTLDWRLRPLWNGVRAALAVPCCASKPLEFNALPHAAGLELEWQDGQSRWPAAMLTGFGAPWNTLKPEGMLDISTQAFSMRWTGRQLALSGRATLNATDISSSLSTLKPMGSYRLTMEGGAQPTLLLATKEGSLQLSGSGRWNGSALRFDGEARAAPGREDALSNLLNIIGRRDGARSLITLG